MQESARTLLVIMGILPSVQKKKEQRKGEHSATNCSFIHNENFKKKSQGKEHKKDTKTDKATTALVK